MSLDDVVASADNSFKNIPLRADSLPLSERYSGYFKHPKDDWYTQPRAVLLNSPQIGLKYFPETELNGLLITAREYHAPLLITGSLTNIDLLRHSVTKILREQNKKYFVGDEDIEIPQILKDKGWGSDFLTKKNIIDSMYNELSRVFAKNEELKVPMYLVLGFMETNTIRKLVDEEITKEVTKKRVELKTLIRTYTDNIKEYKNQIKIINEKKRNLGVLKKELQVYNNCLNEINQAINRDESNKDKKLNEVFTQKDYGLFLRTEDGNQKSILTLEEALQKVQDNKRLVDNLIDDNSYIDILVEKEEDDEFGFEEEDEYDRVDIKTRYEFLKNKIKSDRSTQKELKEFLPHVIKTNYNKIQNLYENIKKEYKIRIESAIPNLTVLDALGRLDLNGVPIEFLYNTDMKSTDTPISLSQKKLEEYAKNKIIKEIQKKRSTYSYEEKVSIPKIIIQGGPIGNFYCSQIRNPLYEEPGDGLKMDYIITVEKSETKPGLIDENLGRRILPEEDKNFIGNESYVFLMNVPEFHDVAEVSKIRHNESMMIKDSLQLSRKKFGLVVPVVPLIDFSVDNSLLHTKLFSLKHLKDIALGNSNVNQKKFYIRVDGDNHYGIREEKKAVFTEEYSKLIYKNYNKKRRVWRLNELYEMFRSKLKFISSDINVGDLIEAKNYSKFDVAVEGALTLNPIQEDLLYDYDSNPEVIRDVLNMDYQISQYLIRNPLTGFQLGRFLRDNRNVNSVDDQLDLPFKVFLTWNKPVLEELLERKEFEGVVKSAANGNHEQNTTNKRDNFNPGIVLVRQYMSKIKLAMGLPFETNNGKIRYGAWGAGLGHMKFNLGVKGHKKYKVLAVHSGKDRSESRRKKTDLNNTFLEDLIFSGHIHRTKIIFDGKLRGIVGSKAGNNEYSLKGNFGSSDTSELIIGAPIDGFEKGEYSFFVVNPEFLTKAVIQQEKVEKLKSLVTPYRSDLL